MNLAAQVEERIIHQSFDVTLIPPQDTGEPGNTDTAYAIGLGLIEEAKRLLCEAARKEGFDVQLETGLLVY